MKNTSGQKLIRVIPDSPYSPNHFHLVSPTAHLRFLDMCNQTDDPLCMLCNMNYSASFEFAVYQRVEPVKNSAIREPKI